MDTKLPAAIMQRICKMIVCAAIITVIGLIWGIASRDAIVVGLTAAIAVAGGLKAWGLYRTAKGQNYEMIEGCLRALNVNKYRKRTEIFLEDSDGEVHHLILEGMHRLQMGAEYRLYVQKVPVDLTHLPDILIPGRTLLGCEKFEHPIC